MEAIVPRMDAAQSRAWVALVTTAALVPAALDEQLTRDAGIINFEYGILSVLNVADDLTVRIGELATTLGVPVPRLSKAVTRLETRGLVERAACPGDGRAISVRLTTEGRRVWLRATPPHVELARDTILGDLDDAELATLGELLERVIRKLDPEFALERALARRAASSSESAAGAGQPGAD